MQFTILGRFVQGSLTEKVQKDMQGQPIPLDKQRWFFAVAVPKAQGQTTLNDLIGFAWNETAAKRGQFAPSIHQNIAAVAQNLSLNLYSLKVEDGDIPAPGKQPNPNIAGCYVFRFSSSFDNIPCCNGQNQFINPAEIKKGWYIEVAGTSALNDKTDHTAGIYLNPVMVRLVGYGEEIRGTADPTQVFGSTFQGQLPPGASAAPLPSSYAMPGQAPAGYPTPQPAAPGLPHGAHAGMPPAAGPASVPPAMGYPSNIPPQTAGNPAPTGVPIGAHAAPAGTPPAAAGYPAPSTAYPGNAPATTAYPPHPGILAGPPRVGA